MSKFAPHRRPANAPRASASTVCQKCLGRGHYTYECKNARPYVSRPSRTQQLENPRALGKLNGGKPSVEVPEEFKQSAGTANRLLEAKEKERAGTDTSKGKKKNRRPDSDGSSSDSSDSDSSSSSSDSDSDSDSDSSSSDSNHSRPRKRSRRTSRSRSRSRNNRNHSRSRSSSADSR
ncbi:zinc knuckle-domain-containing protein [Lentinula raphanica]|nr:zinc knuckle-domain-containing protein [Lentinula raphanica]